MYSCVENSIDGVLKRYNKGSVPYISVKELADSKNHIILDTRERQEFNVSRIPGAMWVGNEAFNRHQFRSRIKKLDASIVVYCSVGVRSEDFGEQLIDAGYTNVKNLYGGIFQWKNSGHMVVDSTSKVTENVHAYSKYWGKLLTEANKVY